MVGKVHFIDLLDMNNIIWHENFRSSCFVPVVEVSLAMKILIQKSAQLCNCRICFGLRLSQSFSTNAFVFVLLSLCEIFCKLKKCLHDFYFYLEYRHHFHISMTLILNMLFPENCILNFKKCCNFCFNHVLFDFVVDNFVLHSS